jgi:hypothetical protein
MIGIGIAGGNYFGLYRPLLKRANAQQALMNESVQSHSVELEQLRSRFEAKQQNMQAELSAARSQLNGAEPAAAALKVGTEAPTAKPEAVGPAAAVAPEPAAAKLETKTVIEPTKTAVARTSKAATAKAKRAEKRRAKRAASEAAAAESAKPKAAAPKAAAKPAAASKPLTEEEDLDRKMQRALRDNENVDDDPIGGLE